MKFSFFSTTVFLTLCLFLCTAMFSTDALAGNKKRRSSAGPNLKYASIVIDASTGMVLSQENADRNLHPASLTKIMTMALVFDALDSGKISERTRLIASSHSSSMPPSKVGLRPGQSITVYDALRTLATKSANDVAVTVAENLGGSEARFVQLMNLKARQIGMTQTRFVNASGLHDYRQVSTARDMAKLAKYLIDTYPRHYSVFGLKNAYFNGRSMHNHNRLMSTYQGMDGIKTGYVAASGFNLVASVKRGNTRLIGVVFGGRTANSRNEHMRTLLDRGFVKIAQLISAGRVAPPPEMPQIASSTLTSSSIVLPPRKPSGSAPSAPAPQPIVTASNAYPPTDVPAMKSLQITPVIRETRGTDITHSLGQIVVPSANGTAQPQTATQPPPQISPDGTSRWQIQIGAYSDRSSTNQALYNAMIKLPKHLNRGQTVIVPLRTADAQWMFRARLAGYSQKEAIEACSYLKDCLTIGPQDN
ncbi:MAG TPA: serine hydrolase [Alphaproteobacteria bacterium]|nr:serine hydrolase [Alphaproteobacteria bacterium]